jgi:hypothetical protein
MDRWAIHIDVEGFGTLYDHHDDVLLALGALMEGIYRIGTAVFPDSPDRLFAHQIGDGFIIVSEHAAQALDVPVAIAIVLLRHVAVTGRYAKAAIAERGFADIEGCFPQMIRAAPRDTHGRIRMGRGILNTFPVMGPALIRAVGMAKKASGTLWLISQENRHRVPSALSLTEVGADVLAIDWLHADLSLVREIEQKAGLVAPDVTMLEGGLQGYCCSESLSDAWTGTTLRSLGLPSK